MAFDCIFNKSDLDLVFNKSYETLELNGFEMPSDIPRCTNLILSKMNFENKDFVVPNYVKVLLLKEPLNLKRLRCNKIVKLVLEKCDGIFEADIYRLLELRLDYCKNIELDENTILSSRIVMFRNYRSEVRMTETTRKFLKICYFDEMRKRFLKRIKEKRMVADFRLSLERNLRVLGRENCARNRMELLMV